MISTFSNLDLDLEEVDDRMIELQETVSQLIEYQENVDMFKINLSAYCIEKAKILSLIYKFKQVRSFREDNELINKLYDQEEELEQLHNQAYEIVVSIDQV